MYQRTRVVSERRIRWSSKLLDIFEQVILLWVYKVVDMKYNRRGGTKVLSLVDVILSSNGPMPSATRCYCDWARLAVTECSNRHGDRIGPLLLWPSSESYMISIQSEVNIT
jgi:hypothetical protein